MLKLDRNKSNKGHQITPSTISSIDPNHMKTITGGTFDGKGSDAATEE